MHTMECNRDEAVRARDIAEKKYAVQDFAGAKKFLLKAQQLFPGLEGLSQMLPVMEVHAVAQAKLRGGEMDWYGLLQVEPGADDSLIKKQYRKLALLLHPDKNKAVGAEAAFKLIGEAWGILSDKSKRQLHDMRRGLKMKVPGPRMVPPAEQNVHYPASCHFASGAAPVPPQDTFWTYCPRCRMQFQYLRTYENSQLQCTTCKEVYRARDISGSNGGYAWSPYTETHRQDFNFKMTGAFSAPNGFVNGPFQHVFPARQPVPGPTAGVFSQAAAAAAAASKVAAAAAAAATPVPSNNVAADVVQQTYNKVKRDRVEAEKETKRKEKELRRKENEERRKELRKQREAQRHQEAMDRLVSKRRENESKMDSRRKLETRSNRRFKRKRRGSEQEDEHDAEEEFKTSEQVSESEPALADMPRRRSLRAKKNVSTYNVDNSDSDMEDFPAPKRTKSEDEADREISGRVTPEERSGRNLASQHSENGGRAEKGKSVAHDEKKGSGVNGCEGLRSAAEGELREVNLGGVEHKEFNNGASDMLGKGSSKQETFDGTMRQEDYTVNLHGQHTRGSPKSKTVKGISKTEPSGMMDEKPRFDSSAEQRDFKLEERRDEKSPCKSPSMTVRTRSKSSEPSKKQAHETVSRDGEEKEDASKPETERHKSCPTDTSSSSSDDNQGHMYVPDPDFHDFDARRTETDVLAGQVWAIYDDQDGMPRFYGRVSKVSLSPFKANVCWLEPTPATLQNNPWVEGSGLSITCGEFKIGKAIVSEQVNIFSHLVLDKVGKGLVRIYPRKGEVWATFKEWDEDHAGGPKARPKGNGYTYSYEMVEVLTDYVEERGCKVVRLAKVKGFKTLFERVEGCAAHKNFRSSDLPKFSHWVISQKLYKDDALGIPAGALELDPAATPLDLILGSSAR